jgi:hypothetical protein
MKHLILLLTSLTLLTATSGAQTSAVPEGGTLLEIHRFSWGGASYFPGGETPAATEAARRYVYEHRAGRGDYGVVIELKNLAHKTIKSVSVDFVFRDTATEREFLTYHFRFDPEIRPGHKKVIRHKVAGGKEPGNFAPASPGEELLDRTGSCGDGPLIRDRKSGKLVKIRDDEKLLRTYPCYYLPVVTRVEYSDGSAWQP